MVELDQSELEGRWERLARLARGRAPRSTCLLLNNKKRDGLILEQGQRTASTDRAELGPK